MINRLLFFLSVVLLLSSCHSYKKIAYLQPKSSLDTVFNKAITLYKLQPSDQLFVKVKSLDPSVNELFNMDFGANSTSMSSMVGGGNMYLMSYVIDIEGNINLPVLGKLKVGGLTLPEVTALVESKADEYLKEPRIDVKLVSFKITLLGEVKSPGQKTIMNDKANLFEAIALGGDLTYFANRYKIQIIRETEKQMMIEEIDITDRDIMSKPQFFLYPNDIIYVEPLRSSTFRMNLSDYSTIIGTISSSLALILLITNLGR